MNGQASLQVRLNYQSGKPIYLQIVDQVKIAAAAGSVAPGEALPSIRDFAEQLRVNRNTIAKAFAELEAAGVVESVPGKGCFVRNGPSPYRKAVRDQMLITEIDQTIVTAHHLQVGAEEFVRLVRQRLDAFEQARHDSEERSTAKDL